MTVGRRHHLLHDFVVIDIWVVGPDIHQAGLFVPLSSLCVHGKAAIVSSILAVHARLLQVGRRNDIGSSLGNVFKLVTIEAILVFFLVIPQFQALFQLRGKDAFNRFLHRGIFGQ